LKQFSDNHGGHCVPLTDPERLMRAFCSLVLVSSCIWALCPSVAECAPQSHTIVSPQEPNALNLLGIRYAKGQGVKRNPGLAMRFFLRSATQGYTPAMANLGTLYELGAIRHADFLRAYAWIRAALWFGVPEEDHEETVVKLWMIGARLGPARTESGERLADMIATRIVETCKCAPGQEPEFASIHFL
jgi:TPR repeat protein